MATLRDFAYDHPNYTVVRTYHSGSNDMASAVGMATFRSRVACVVTRLVMAVESVSSVAKVTFTVERGGSVNTTYTLASCTTVGNITQVSLDITLLSAGDLLAVKHNDTGDYTILYEYQVLPGQSFAVRA